MTPINRPLLILGTNTFAADVADFAAEIPGVIVAGFVEEKDQSLCEKPLEGKPVHWVDELPALAKTHCFISGWTTTHRHRFVGKAIAAGCEFVTLVHPTARVPATTSLGKGTLVNVGAIIASHTHLGEHVCVNRGAIIGHHTRIEDFATISPGVNLAGLCHVGRGAYLAIGATIIDRINIGAGAIVGAGAVVTEDVPERVLVLGVPAKIVKRDVEAK